MAEASVQRRDREIERLQRQRVESYAFATAAPARVNLLVRAEKVEGMCSEGHASAELSVPHAHTHTLTLKTQLILPHTHPH